MTLEGIAPPQVLPVALRRGREIAGEDLGAPDTCDIYRLICPCFVTGEAAGTAAAMAAKKGCYVRAIDISALQKTLRKANVWLG